MPLTPLAQSYLRSGPTLISGLGGSTGFGENSLPTFDDGSSAAIDITPVFGQAGINFFGQNYTSLYINNNGNITFASPSGIFTPTEITGGANNPIIAAFWADVDTRGGVTGPTPGGTSTGSNLVHWDLDGTNGVLTVTWDDVGYYAGHTDRANAFQIQLINSGNGDFEIVFRYEDINWTTGDASGGTGGLGGTVARAGYSAGNGRSYYEIPGSGDQQRMLDLEDTAGNTGLQGLDVFQVRNGRVGRVPNDFNNDGKSDILLQGGTNVVEWFLQNGAYSGGALVGGNLPPGWSVVGSGDFNGDQNPDLLLQGGTTVVEWFLNDAGQYSGGNVLSTNLPAEWSVVGTGDVNGDGVSDVVLQAGTAAVNWLLSSGGGYQSGNVLTTLLAPGIRVVGVGDVNGDGIGDILLQGGGSVVEWLMNDTGRYAGGRVLTASLPEGWTVRALGDVNGDSTSDLILQGGSYVVDWMMHNGAVVGSNVISSGLPAGWNVTGTGDYNGDGTSDISLQGGGTVVNWLLQNGQYAGGNVLATNLPSDWTVVGKT